MSCQTGTCNSGKYYVGDIGTELIVDVCVDISTATSLKLFVMKPGDLVAEEWNGGLYQAHYIRYVITAGDLDRAGEYRVQAWIQLPTGEWRGDVDKFTVCDVFT